MRLARALAEKLHDVRLRDKLLAEGKITKAQLDEYLSTIEDSKDNAEATISEALPYFKRKNVVATVILLEEFMVGVKEIDLFKKILENMTILYGEHIFWREISKLDQGNKLFL